MKSFSLSPTSFLRYASSKAVGHAILLASLMATSQSQAADYFVPQTNDGRSHAEQFIEALRSAELTPNEADTIFIAAGTYTFDNYSDEGAGYNALPTVSTEITLKGAGAESTIIERNQSASTPIFRLMHVAATGKLTLEGVTLQGGETTCIGDPRCDSQFNFPGDTGGAIFVAATVDQLDQPIQGQLYVIDSVLTDNYSENCGGAIRNDGGLVHVERSIISNNRTRYVIDGAGIYNDAHYSEDNDNNGNSKTTLVRGKTTVIDSSFIGNLGGGQGAAIFNENGFVKVSNSSIIGNWARFNGGGIGNGYGITEIENSTIFGNYSGHRGGGVYGGKSSELATDSQDSIIRINNSTVTGNMSEKDSGDGHAGGGGIAVYFGSIEMQNTIVSNNSAPLGIDCRVNRSSAKLISLGNNLIGDANGCEAITTAGNNDLYQDPALDLCMSNGEPGKAHLPLRLASPARDAADALACTSVDQLGRTRNNCDIGAVEYDDSPNQGSFNRSCHIATSDDYDNALPPPDEEDGNSEETPAESNETVVQSSDENQSTVETVSLPANPAPASGGGGTGLWLSLLLPIFVLRRGHQLSTRL